MRRWTRSSFAMLHFAKPPQQQQHQPGAVRRDVWHPRDLACLTPMGRAARHRPDRLERIGLARCETRRQATYPTDCLLSAHRRRYLPASWPARSRPEPRCPRSMNGPAALSPRTASPVQAEHGHQEGGQLVGLVVRHEVLLLQHRDERQKRSLWMWRSSPRRLKMSALYLPANARLLGKSPSSSMI